MEPLIFEKSRSGRRAFAQSPGVSGDLDIPESFLRKDKPLLPEASELQVVRHFTRLSQLNFSIDTQFYPLGSCTMKYNPRACNALALLPGFAGRHPLGPVGHGQGFLTCMYELQEMLKALTGMQGVSLTPMAGAQGELAGVAMIRAYHKARGDLERNEIIVPDAAHGTNPATATMCGCVVRELRTGSDGDIDIDALKEIVGPQTAGIMLTNPSTLGIFERRIVEVARIVHEAGGLLYYDGANLNAICGKVRPGEALAFGLTLSGFSVVTLGLLVNWISAGLLAFTIFFYAVIYTMWLKRSTPQNIVIGGAAGAFPPMIGWAAVTGSLSLEPVILFAIIFFWTPPHFWALAIYKKSDYGRAGVPMLPNVAGDAHTRLQILLYTLILVPLGVSPWLLGYASALYGAVAVVTGAAMILLALQVYREASPADRACRHLFAFSILYLFLLYAVLLVDRGWGGLIARVAA